MKLSPVDIKRQEFKKALRGFDPVEVQTFLELIATRMEELIKESKDLHDRNLELESKLDSYRQIERTLQQTLQQAQDNSSRSVETTRREAELIIQEANAKAARTVEQATTDLTRLKSDVAELRARKESLVGRLRVLLSSELDLLKTLELGNDPVLNSSMSHGTGKDNLELDDILKTL